jgi:hypothetical protein
MNLKGGIIGHKVFLLRQARLDARLPRLSFAMADRLLLYFTLNVFVMGSGIEGIKIFRFIQKQHPLGHMKGR